MRRQKLGNQPTRNAAAQNNNTCEELGYTYGDKPFSTLHMAKVVIQMGMLVTYLLCVSASEAMHMVCQQKVV